MLSNFKDKFECYVASFEIRDKIYDILEHTNNDNMPIYLVDIKKEIGELFLNGYALNFEESKIPFSENAKKSLDYAVKSAIEMGHYKVGNLTIGVSDAHLALGLYRINEGNAYEIFNDLYGLIDINEWTEAINEKIG